MELPSPAASVGTTTSIAAFSRRAESSTAEVLCTLKSVTSHFSNNSSSGIGDLFRRMFPDSVIAQQFGVSERKYAYLTNIGLAPFFKDALNTRIRQRASFVLMFDESFNQKTSSKQLDVHVRTWDDGQVCSCYYDSSFLGHASAEVVLESLLDISRKLELRKLSQVSMDGPNVNWKTLRLLQEHLKSTVGRQALDIGSYGLHNVQGAFQPGALKSGWEPNKLLSAMYYLFHESPAKREDYDSMRRRRNRRTSLSDSVLTAGWRMARWQTESAVPV